MKYYEALSAANLPPLPILKKIWFIPKNATFFPKENEKNLHVCQNRIPRVWRKKLRKKYLFSEI